MNHSSTKDYSPRHPGWTCEDEIDSLHAEVARRPTALQLNDIEDQRDAAETMLKEAELERDEHAKLVEEVERQMELQGLSEEVPVDYIDIRGHAEDCSLAAVKAEEPAPLEAAPPVCAECGVEIEAGRSGPEAEPPAPSPAPDTKEKP